MIAVRPCFALRRKTTENIDWFSSNCIKVELPFNESLFNEDLGITIDILSPGNSKIDGKDNASL